MSRNVEINQGKTGVTTEIAESVSGLGTNAVREVLGPPHSRWNIDGLIWLYLFQNTSEGNDQRFSVELHFDNKGLVKEILVNDDIAQYEGG